MNDCCKILADRHAAELAKWKEAAEHHLSESNKLGDKLAKVHQLHKAVLDNNNRAHDVRVQDMESLIQRYKDEQIVMTDEMAAADQRWQERLAKVEAANLQEHHSLCSQIELLREVIEDLRKQRTKAVAAAYEEAAKIAQPSDSPHLDSLMIRTRIAKAIRQLAAKPQECTCGPTGCGLHMDGCQSAKVRKPSPADQFVQNVGWRIP